LLRVPAVLGLYATSSLFVIIIVVIIKGKGTESECGIRPITLLSIPGKLFANVLLERIQPFIDMSGRPEQSCFVAGRSSVDAILALRLLSDLHREFDRPLNVAILDIKTAFNSVERRALWKALRSPGTILRSPGLPLRSYSSSP